MSCFLQSYRKNIECVSIILFPGLVSFVSFCYLQKDCRVVLAAKGIIKSRPFIWESIKWYTWPEKKKKLKTVAHCVPANWKWQQVYYHQIHIFHVLFLFIQSLASERWGGSSRHHGRGQLQNPRDKPWLVSPFRNLLYLLLWKTSTITITTSIYFMYWQTLPWAIL